MHDLDRTQLEASDGSEFEYGSGEFELEGGSNYEGGGPEGERFLDETDEMELAAQFLEIQDEAELDQFISNLIDRVRKGARRFFKSPLGQQLGKFLKGAAKKILPVAGSVAGGVFGGPAGAAIGGKLASGAGKALGLELEGLSPEDREFEVARQYVRFANAAIQNAADADADAPPETPPEDTAKAATVAAARQHAPGLLRPAGGRMRPGMRMSGRWVRRGNRILLLGV